MVRVLVVFLVGCGWSPTWTVLCRDSQHPGVAVSHVNLRSGSAADPGGVSAVPCNIPGPGRDPGLSSGPLVFWFASALFVNMSSKLRVSWNWTDVCCGSIRVGVEDARPWRCFLGGGVCVLPCGFSSCLWLPEIFLPRSWCRARAGSRVGAAAE